MQPGHGCKPIVERHAGGDRGERDKWLEIVAIARRNSSEEVSVKQQKHYNDSCYIPEPRLSPTEEASDHGHNREWHMVFTEEKLLDVESR